MIKINYKEILAKIHNFCLGNDVDLPDDDIVEYLYNNDPQFKEEYDNDEVIQIAVMSLMGKKGRAMITEFKKRL